MLFFVKLVNVRHKSYFNSKQTFLSTMPLKTLKLEVLSQIDLKAPFKGIDECKLTFIVLLIFRNNLTPDLNTYNNKCPWINKQVLKVQSCQTLNIVKHIRFI